MKYLVEAARAKNLDRVTVGYTVGAWVIIQATATASSAFDWPQWALQAAIIAAVLGFPVVLVAAWALAVRKEAGAFRPSRTDLHVLGVLGIVLVVAATLFVTIFWPHEKVEPLNEQLASAPPPVNSIAVLPFANLSGDPAKQYFSDGVADELIRELSRVPSLRVAARTSSFAFEGKNADVKAIAKLLNVRSILDGSVRESANHIRIETELVNAANGYSIWSETYDRDLTDILALQDDIAGSVTLSLKAKLFGSQFNARDAQGINPEAYKLYLQAKFAFHRGNLDDLKQATALLRQVTVLAPKFANGFFLLGAVQRELADRYNKIEFLVPAEAASRQAIRLDSKNLEALSILTQLLLDRWQWKEALDTFQQVQFINPNSATALHLRSVLAYVFNYPAEDIAAEMKASALNPLAAGLKYNIALWYANQAHFAEAATAIKGVFKLRQGKFTDLDEQCALEASSGNLAGARQIMEKLSAFYASDPQFSLNCPFSLAVAEKNLPLARKVADAAAADASMNGGALTSIGDSYRQIGDFDNAMKWYERAYAARDSLLLGVPYEKWQTPALLSDPGWKALWARQPIREWEAARIEAGKILGVAN